LKKISHSTCVILGGGGHASVLVDALCASGQAKPYAILDADSRLWGQDLFGVPILGGDDLLSDMAGSGVDCFAVGVGAVGDNRPRQRLFDIGLSYGLRPLTVVHPQAICSRWADIGSGCQLLPGSIVNAMAKIGVNVIINSGAIIEHECVLGDHIHVATGAHLAGAVRVGKGAHLGIGATVKEGVVIGEGAIVGAGAVVIHDVLPNTVVAGVPARPLRRNSDVLSK
jgi:sugar O-acyltransferase (sialic acid O-acetyltransferase NeuD family)